MEQQYTALVKWSGNHYHSGQTIKGSKIKQDTDGKTYLFNDELIEFPWGEVTHNEWVEVYQPSVKLNDKPVHFELKDTTPCPTTFDE